MQMLKILIRLFHNLSCRTYILKTFAGDRRARRGVHLRHLPHGNYRQAEGADVTVTEYTDLPAISSAYQDVEHVTALGRAYK